MFNHSTLSSEAVSLKILYLTAWYPNPDDPTKGQFVRQQAEAVAQHCDVALLYVFATSQEIKTFEFQIETKNKVKTVVVCFKKSLFRIHYINLIFNTIKYLIAFFLGLKFCFKNYGKPNIVHVHVLTRTGIIALIIKKIWSIPYLITEHWSRYFNHSGSYKGWLRKFLTKYVVANASAVMPVTSHLKNAMLQHGLYNSNYQVVPNIVEFYDFPLPSKLQNSEKQILFVGDLNDFIKNISGILEAFQLAVKEYNKLVLHIIGEGIDRKYLEHKAIEMQIANKVHFYGSQKHAEVLKFYHKADFYILNSFFETFSISTAEAIVAGCPVIISDCKGPEEFVNETNGIIIEKNNHKALATGILKMVEIHNSFDKKTMSNQIKNKYGKENILNLILHEYKKCTSTL